MMLKSAFIAILYIQLRIYSSHEYKRFVMRSKKASNEI
jgi:hypothetical protein